MVEAGIDPYLNDKKKKYFDLFVGFSLAVIFWFLTFHFYWYLGPVIVSLISGFALKKRVERKYVPIGALGLFALPFLIWWFGLLFLMGIRAD